MSESKTVKITSVLPEPYRDAAQAKAAELGVSVNRYIARLIYDDATPTVKKTLPEIRAAHRPKKDQ